MSDIPDGDRKIDILFYSVPLNTQESKSKRTNFFLLSLLKKLRGILTMTNRIFSNVTPPATVLVVDEFESATNSNEYFGLFAYTFHSKKNH